MLVIWPSGQVAIGWIDIRWHHHVTTGLVHIWWYGHVTVVRSMRKEVLTLCFYEKVMSALRVYICSDECDWIWFDPWNVNSSLNMYNLHPHSLGWHVLHWQLSQQNNQNTHDYLCERSETRYSIILMCKLNRPSKSFSTKHFPFHRTMTTLQPIPKLLLLPWTFPLIPNFHPVPIYPTPRLCSHSSTFIPASNLGPISLPLSFTSLPNS